MTANLGLSLATLAFVGTHLILSHPLRPTLAARLGERGFLGLYSLVALATLGWIILAYRSADAGSPLWIAPLWWWPVASGIMLIASILLVGSLVGNPAFPQPGAPPRDIPAPRGVFAITRHPMNWSFMLWALVHMSVSGNARNLIVASGILLLAVAGSIGQDRKKARLLGQSWRDWQARTSFIPFVGLIQGKARWREAAPGWIAVAGGLTLWAAATSLHVPMYPRLASCSTPPARAST